VSEAEELRRVLPVVEALAGDPRFVLSIDTMKPAVASAALARGAAIVNDVTGLREPAMRAVVAETGAGAVAMHMQGTPATMQADPRYGDVVAEIRESLRQSMESSLRSGIDMLRLSLDPGIGFGKTAAHNLTLLRRLGELEVEGRPLTLGVSRKSFLSLASGSPRAEDRAWPTVAITSLARTLGARIFRVHEVRPNLEALRMTEAILHA
jgi:dihydropteroate synthase